MCKGESVVLGSNAHKKYVKDLNLIQSLKKFGNIIMTIEVSQIL